MAETTDAPQGSTSADSVVERRSGTADVGLRPEVAAFAWLMEEALRKHDGERGPKGWQGDDYRALLARLEEESAELAAALSRLVATDSESFVSIARSADVGKEAADVGNFAMMIADAVGALVAPMHRLQPSGAADVGDARGVLGYVVVETVGHPVDGMVFRSAVTPLQGSAEAAERIRVDSWPDHDGMGGRRYTYTVAPVGSPGGDAPAERLAAGWLSEPDRDGVRYLHPAPTELCEPVECVAAAGARHTPPASEDPATPTTEGGAS